MANSVWTAPARSDWGWGLLFSLFGPPRGQARKMTAAVWVGGKVRSRSAAEAAPPYWSIRTKPLLLEPRFSASAPLRGFLHAAWWVVPRPAAGSTSPSASTRPREAGVWSVLGELCLFCVLCVCVCVCLCVFVCGCVCVCSCVFVCVSVFYWVCFGFFVSSCACCWHLWVSLWHFARPCGVSLALWVFFWLHCGTLGFHFDTHGV